MRPRLTYANVTATLALIIAVGGASAFAATQLAKNSVGAKQLKKNSVTTAKIKNEAVTAAKVKKGTLTGAQINVSTLGTVPTAQTADTAKTANLANSLAPSEGWHEVTEFFNGWEGSMPASGPLNESVAFYKDQQGVVHLRGEVSSGTQGTVIFHLPPGYRPASGRYIQEPVACFGGAGCPNEVRSVAIVGLNSPIAGGDGAVFAPSETANVFLDGITFRAES
jgi:hypothetical protein